MCLEIPFAQILGLIQPLDFRHVCTVLAKQLKGQKIFGVDSTVTIIFGQKPNFEPWFRDKPNSSKDMKLVI